MIYNLGNEYDIPRFKEAVKKLLEEGGIVELKKKNPRRSLNQNSYLHVCLGYFAVEYGCSLEEAKVLYYKQEVNKEIFVRERVNKRGKRITYLRSSADLDTKEMTTSIERFRNWAAQGGIYISSPEDRDFLIYAQQQIELNKEFI